MINSPARASISVGPKAVREGVRRLKLNRSRICDASPLNGEAPMKGIRHADRRNSATSQAVCDNSRAIRPAAKLKFGAKLKGASMVTLEIDAGLSLLVRLDTINRTVLLSGAR